MQIIMIAFRTRQGGRLTPALLSRLSDMARAASGRIRLYGSACRRCGHWLQQGRLCVPCGVLLTNPN